MPLDLDRGGRIPQNVKTYLGPTTGWKYTDAPSDINYVIDGGGQVPSVGFKGYLICPDWLVINNWVLLSDLSGSVVMDVWKVPLVTFLAGTPPNITNSITGSTKPTITSAVSASSSVLTGWTTQINQNDVLGFNLVSIATIQRFTLILRCVRIIGLS